MKFFREAFQFPLHLLDQQLRFDAVEVRQIFFAAHHHGAEKNQKLHRYLSRSSPGETARG